MTEHRQNRGSVPSVSLTCSCVPSFSRLPVWEAEKSLCPRGHPVGELTQSGAPRKPRQLSNHQLLEAADASTPPQGVGVAPDLIDRVCVGVFSQTCVPKQWVLGAARIPHQHFPAVQPPYGDRIASATPSNPFMPCSQNKGLL